MESEQVRKIKEYIYNQIVAKIRDIAGSALEVYDKTLKDLCAANEVILAAAKDGFVEREAIDNREILQAEVEKAAAAVWAKLKPTITEIKDENLNLLREAFDGLYQGICCVYAHLYLNCCEPDDFKKLLDFKIQWEPLDHINEDIKKGNALYQIRQPLKVKFEKH